MVNIMIIGMNAGATNKIQSLFTESKISKYEFDKIYPDDELFDACICTKYELVPFKIGMIVKHISYSDYLYISIE